MIPLQKKRTGISELTQFKLLGMFVMALPSMMFLRASIVGNWTEYNGRRVPKCKQTYERLRKKHRAYLNEKRYVTSQTRDELVKKVRHCGEVMARRIRVLVSLNLYDFIHDA